MALALTNNFREFYGKATVKEASAIFRSVVDAPWMSSGLTANNAFTTTLVLRTFGFLEEEKLFGRQPALGDSAKNEWTKTWELHLGIKNVFSLATRLTKHTDAASDYLWLSLSDKTRNDLQKKTSPAYVGPKKRTENELRATLALDLRRIVQSGWIYESSRFTKASKSTKKRLAKKPTGYILADVNHKLLIDQFSSEFAKPRSLPLGDIAALMAGEADNFSINDYPPSAAVLYWFVDGVARARITLPVDRWTKLCGWATKEFNHQRSLVVAEHDAMMDPVAMGMSACLCARLRAISEESYLGTTKHHVAILPSVVELECSIAELILKQTPSGIFHKYFPMFHYEDAGSNFCFTFELLEAVLHEFGGNDNQVLNNPLFIDGLEKAVTWCESNRQKYSDKSIEYTGWNSGGDLSTLKKEQPESWATAVVHMFLWELTTTISQRIQQEILTKYNAHVPAKRPIGVPTGKDTTVSPAIDQLLDIEILLKNKPQTLSSLLKAQIIKHYRSENEATLRRRPIKKPLSALLFGPPGTSKTEMTKAVAADLNWPLVEINPSDFVKGTLANVYLQADEIFDDLMDLSGVVVFFDEMDALVQARDTDVHLDIASQFLTTTMLPKLTRLHDEARVVFFMATNFQERFDPAIKRAGRFDLLLCMGPPKLSEKLDRLHRAYLLESETAQTTEAGKLIKRYLKKPELLDKLELYTFGEFRAFLKTLGDENAIGDEIKKLGPAKFEQKLDEDSRYVILKTSDLDPLQKIGVTWKRIADLDQAAFTLKQLEDKDLQPTHVIRYFCDRKESKEQH